MHTTVTEQTFDLVACAKRHRYRLRNLHYGNPVPLARCKRNLGMTRGHWGLDRLDAIVGRRGYVAMDGDELSVCVFCKSSQGVTYAVRQLESAGARIDQVGDTEAGATVPVGQIDDALKIIRVLKLHPGNPEWHNSLVQSEGLDAESPESCQVVNRSTRRRTIVSRPNSRSERHSPQGTALPPRTSVRRGYTASEDTSTTLDSAARNALAASSGDALART